MASASAHSASDPFDPSGTSADDPSRTSLGASADDPFRDDAAFDDVVSDALDLVPAAMLDALDNVVFLVEDERPGAPNLLGLYEGVPIPARGDNPGFLPDRITIYRTPLRRSARNRAALIREIRVTVVHEAAHHLGIGEKRLHELGWG